MWSWNAQFSEQHMLMKYDSFSNVFSGSWSKTKYKALRNNKYHFWEWEMSLPYQIPSWSTPAYLHFLILF